MNFNIFLKYMQSWVLKHFNAKVWGKGLWPCIQFMNYWDASCLFSCLSIIPSFLMSHLKQLPCAGASLVEGERYPFCSLFYDVSRCLIFSHQPSPWLGSMGGAVCAWLAWESLAPHVAYRSTQHVSWLTVTSETLRHVYDHTLSDRYVTVQFSPWNCSRIETIIWALLVSSITQLEIQKENPAPYLFLTKEWFSCAIEERWPWVSLDFSTKARSDRSTHEEQISS